MYRPQLIHHQYITKVGGTFRLHKGTVSDCGTMAKSKTHPSQTKPLQSTKQNCSLYFPETPFYFLIQTTELQMDDHSQVGFSGIFTSVFAFTEKHLGTRLLRRDGLQNSIDRYSFGLRIGEISTFADTPITQTALVHIYIYIYHHHDWTFHHA
jgi:hypothetical protein